MLEKLLEIDPDVKVIVSTGYGGSADRGEMIEAIRGSLATHAQASGSVSSAAERILSVAHKSLERIADARSALRSAQADESAETTSD